MTVLSAIEGKCFLTYLLVLISICPLLQVKMGVVNVAATAAAAANGNTHGTAIENSISKALVTSEAAQETITKTLKVMNKMDLTSVFKTVAKALTVIGPVFMIASTVLSIISMFMPQEESEQLRLLHEGFSQVNHKLDTLHISMQEIKQIVQVVGAKQNIMSAVDSIFNLDEELQFAVNSRTRFAYVYFAHRYDASYRYAADRVWQALMGVNDSSEYHFDLLRVYQNHFKCNQMSLMKMCISGIQLINKGITIQATYFGIIRYPRRARYLQKMWIDRLNRLQERCSQMMMECEHNYKHWFNEVFNEHYHTWITRLTPEEYAVSLKNTISEVLPFRNWAVFASLDDQIDTFNCQFEARTILAQRLSENKRHVIVSSSPRGTVMQVKKINQMLISLGNQVKAAKVCMKSYATPIFYEPAKYFMTLIKQRTPRLNIFICKASASPFLSSSEDHWGGHNLGPGSCLRETYRILVFI